MSRSEPVTSQTPPTTAPTAEALPNALSAVAAAAAQDRSDTFNDSVAVARTKGATKSAIVGAYADGGLRRLEQGLPPVSFSWTGQPF